MMRILNICVIAGLVLAAAHVYKIKFEATRQAEAVAKVRLEIRRERDQVASLRAQWGRLDSPARVQQLARRHLALKPIDVLQFDALDRLPERPRQLVPPDTPDPIGALLDIPEIAEVPTGGIAAPQAPR